MRHTKYKKYKEMQKKSTNSFVKDAFLKFKEYIALSIIERYVAKYRRIVLL